jgi:hypothetical protein
MTLEGPTYTTPVHVWKPRMRQSDPTKVSGKTLVIEVALPDFYTEDIDLTLAREWHNGDTSAFLMDDTMRLARHEIEFDVLVEGEKDAATVRVKGEIVGAKLVSRE